MATSRDNERRAETRAPAARPVVDSTRHRYPALEAWRTAARNGVKFSADHPLERAACREANAEEYDALADRALTPREAATWRRVAADEMAEAMTILTFLAEAGMAPSRSRARDLIQQGGVYFYPHGEAGESERITDLGFSVPARDGAIVQVGKLQFVRIRASQ